MDQKGLITIFGGSGFVGRHTVRALAKRGYRIRVAVRRPDLALHVVPTGSVGQVLPIQANLRYEESVKRAVDGADAVINLVGVMATGGKNSAHAVHEEGAATVAEAASKAGASSLVHVSAIGADPESESEYASTKGRGEEAVSSAFKGATILRPSIIFGPEDDFFNRFATMARYSPALPLIGGGLTKFQPVYVGDVAQAIVGSVEGNARSDTIYELGGPRVASFKELMELMLREIERERLLVPLPFSLAAFKALFLQYMPGSPLTPDQVIMLKQDNIVSQKAIDEGRTLEGLGLHPAAMESILPSYLWRFRKTGQFRSSADKKPV